MRTYAEIDLDAIGNNFRELKKCVNNTTMLCAVIKADGYGHGAVMIAEYLKDIADYFAVATADEAIELRTAGITTPILILAYVHEDEYKELIENNIELTVFTSDSAKKISEIALSTAKTAKIHIAVDTGMSRIGFIPDTNAVTSVKEISALSNVEIAGIFSHYACADMADKTVSEKQTQSFRTFVSDCENCGINFPVKHICNSAAISEFSEHFDMVRMGISLYGLYPSEEVDKTKISLIPAMTFKSHITNVKTVPANMGISYGHTYTTENERIIATVCAGYADGYPRAMTNSGRVLVNGRFAPITGRVCMDQFMIDVTDIPDVKVNDEVILFGGNGASAEEIGEKSMSFNYEVVCSISRRVPRVYKKDGKTVSIKNYLR